MLLTVVRFFGIIVQVVEIGYLRSGFNEYLVCG